MTERFYLEDYKDFTVITLRLYDNENKFEHYDWLTESHKIVDLLNTLHKENKELKEEVEMLIKGLDDYENTLPLFLTCGEVNHFHSKISNFTLERMKFYKNHPNLCETVVVRYDD